MKHPIDVFVGMKIRQQRWVTGITQQGLAAQVGIKFQQIQKYETGVNRVSASRLWDIAKVLGVPVSHFFEGAEDLDGEGKSAAQQNALGSKEIASLIGIYSRIPDKQRRKFFDLAETLATE